MQDHENLAARFDVAETLWRASVHVIVRPHSEYVQSSTLLRTTAGIVAKRDIVAVSPDKPAPMVVVRARKPKPSVLTRLRSDLSLVMLLATGIAAALAVLALATFSH